MLDSPRGMEATQAQRCSLALAAAGGAFATFMEHLQSIIPWKAGQNGAGLALEVVLKLALAAALQTRLAEAHTGECSGISSGRRREATRVLQGA